MKHIKSNNDLWDYLFTIPKIWRDTPLEVAFELYARQMIAKGFSIYVTFNKKNEKFIVRDYSNNGFAPLSPRGWITTPLPKQAEKNRKKLRKMMHY